MFQARRGWIGGVAAAAVVVAVAAYVFMTRTPPTSDPAPAEIASLPAPNGQDEAEAPKPAEKAASDAPSFDEVRRDTDGMTVIAGRAVPGSKVRVLSNGTEIATVTADGSGKFAALAILPPDGDGKVLQLEASSPEGPVLSDADVILAPMTAPAEQGTETAQVATAAATSDITAKAPAPVADASDTPDASDPAAQMTAAAQAPADISAPAEATTVPVDAPEEMSKPAQATTASLKAPDGVPPPAQAPSLSIDAPEGMSVAVASDISTEAPQMPAPVQPLQRIAALKSTAEGVELLSQPAEPAEKIELDTITYSETGEVRLAGRSQSGAQSVRVYLDNGAVSTLDVDDQGRWRGDIDDIPAGIYTLRVDELNQGGEVISRVETPFKRETPEALARATASLTGPISAVTVQEGATLWAIARERYGDPLLYVSVFEANRDSIRDPDLIYPGQVFDLPAR